MSRRTTALLVAFPIVCVLATVLIALRVFGGDQLVDAETECEVSGAPEIVQVGDDGDTLTVTAVGQPVNVNKAADCVLSELEAPDSLRAKMDETTANQGRLQDSWDGYDVSWTYHPDDGLNLIVEKG